jgi:hypothetical protein
MGQYNYDVHPDRERKITYQAKMVAETDLGADLSYFDDNEIEDMKRFKAGELNFLFVRANVVFTIPAGGENSIAFMEIPVLSPGQGAVRNDDLETIREVFEEETKLVLDAITEIARVLTGASPTIETVEAALFQMAEEPQMTDNEHTQEQPEIAVEETTQEATETAIPEATVTAEAGDGGSGGVGPANEGQAQEITA